MPIAILSHGYELPTGVTTGDRHFPAMERNIQRMNDHDHDGGEGGARLSATLVDALEDNWSADLGGNSYRQLVDVPEGFEFDNCRIEVRRSTGEVVYPDIVQVDESSFYLYTNDNSVSYKLSFL